MNFKDLQTNVMALNAAMETIEKRREHWHTSKMGMVKEIFTNLPTVYTGLKLGSSVIDRYNNESIHLYFHQQPSGIADVGEGNYKHYLKYGGELVFRIRYNGLISVDINFPSVEDLIDQIPTKNIEIGIEPNNINESFIFEQVEKFLDEMIKWELS